MIVKKGISKLLFVVKKSLERMKRGLQSTYSSHVQMPNILKKTHIESDKKVAHIAAYTLANAGDTILPVAVRDILEWPSSSSYKWSGIHVHQKVDKKTIENINKQKGLIIGGGGLFLADTNPNNLSGWQWSCSMDSLNKIKVPIAVFAVGYNRFRGQKEFSDLFTQHVNLLAEKSAFFGLRNQGSIESIKGYIYEKNHHKIKFQPCPTTVISHLYPELVKKSRDSAKRPFIAVNIAFDRSSLRYGEKIGEKLTAIARVIKILSVDFEIKYYSHMISDNYFLPYLECFDVKYELIILNKEPEEIIKLYSTPALTIGMRGHAQMIPFGCGTAILSIISHEKLGYFLDDIKHSEWGIDINHEDFEDALLNKSLYVLQNTAQIKKQLKESQDILFDVSKKNTEHIKKAFKL